MRTLSLMTATYAAMNTPTTNITHSITQVFMTTYTMKQILVSMVSMEVSGKSLTTFTGTTIQFLLRKIYIIGTSRLTSEIKIPTSSGLQTQHTHTVRLTLCTTITLSIIQISKTTTMTSKR